MEKPSKKIIGISMALVTLFLFLRVVEIAALPLSICYSGHVYDRNGRAISNAKITLYIGGSRYDTDYTDSNGYYSFYDLLLGANPYLKAEKTKWAIQTKTVSSTSGGTLIISICTSVLVI